MTECEEMKFDECMDCTHFRVRREEQVLTRTCKNCDAGEEFEESDVLGVDEYLRDANDR